MWLQTKNTSFLSFENNLKNNQNQQVNAKVEIRVFELCWKEVIFALIQHQSTEYIFIFDSLIIASGNCL